jgi:nitrogen regulatory protein P-II 1
MSRATTQRFDRFREGIAMKLLKCIVRPNALEKVKEALSALGVMGMTVSEVKGYGRQKGHKEVYRGAEYNIDFTPKLEIEVVVGEAIAERAIDAVKEAANTGNIGDGKIFVVPVDQVVRIRTGEMGDSAI